MANSQTPAQWLLQQFDTGEQRREHPGMYRKGLYTIKHDHPAPVCRDGLSCVDSPAEWPTPTALQALVTPTVRCAPNETFRLLMLEEEDVA